MLLVRAESMNWQFWRRIAAAGSHPAVNDGLEFDRQSGATQFKLALASNLYRTVVVDFGLMLT
jgi:hypothetical protein